METPDIGTFPAEQKSKKDMPQKAADNLISVGAFLSNSVEIKRNYNNYVVIAFKRELLSRRTKEKDIPFLQTEKDWMDLFTNFANKVR